MRKSRYVNVNIINALIAIINPSSIIVIVLIGRLKISPRQAHLIFRLLKTDCKTPIILTNITIKVSMLVISGLKLIKYAIPRIISMNGYM